VNNGAESDRSLPPHDPDPCPAEHRAEADRTGRSILLVVALVLLVAGLAPPLGLWARRYEVAEAIQFSFLAIVVPALVVIGAPWRVRGLYPRPGRPFGDGAGLRGGEDRGLAGRLAFERRRHPHVLRSMVFASWYLAGVVLWRIPPTVDALARHPWLVVVEATTLVAAGTGLWLELVESPPFTPRLSRPNRVALAAVSMWAIWVLAYLVGLSHASWYSAYAHHAGSGLSVSADQQLATGMLWFISGCAFVPVVFWDLVRWLQSEEDPDQEMVKMVRTERIRGRTVDGGRARS
jgi:cytochrome c oxidase assembly factor CtaG